MEIQFEYFFEDTNKYLNFTYQFHYIFKRWESDLIGIKKPSQRLIMARFLMKVYHLNNLLKRGIFQKWQPCTNITSLQLQYAKLINEINSSSCTIRFGLSSTKMSEMLCLKKKYNIATNSYPPPVFSNFDVIQQQYFKYKDLSYVSDDFPNGQIMKQTELPGRIISSILRIKKEDLSSLVEDQISS